MTILITEIDSGWQISYTINGNSCIHQFEEWKEVVEDLKEMDQIQYNLFKCPNPAPNRLLKKLILGK